MEKKNYRIGFKHIIKSLNRCSYSMFDTYYENPEEAYQDTFECEKEEKESGIKMYGYYVIQDFNTKRIYSLLAFKRIVLCGEVIE